MRLFRQPAVTAINTRLLVRDIQMRSACFLDEFDQGVDGLTHDSSFCVRDA